MTEREPIGWRSEVRAIVAHLLNRVEALEARVEALEARAQELEARAQEVNGGKGK